MRANTLVMVASLVGLFGCISLEVGAPVRVDRLGSLTPKVSTKSDVLLVLGEPSGTGAMRLNPQSAKRDVWFYEHINSQSSITGSSKQKVTILLVFFDADHYEGHYWFGETANLGR